MNQLKAYILRGFILIFLLTLFSCKQDKKVEQKPAVTYNKKDIEEVNKHLVNKDTEVIESYVKRRGWDMSMTETGLWYMIYKQGEGDYVQKGNYVNIDYKVWLIDGTLCYSSDSLGVKSFIVGQGGVESGLEEGILMLQEGSKARFIMPPHLAHGLIGDENRIPARAIIIYDLELLSIED